jgi:transcriptional regulator with XRE-family HTH domain
MGRPKKTIDPIPAKRLREVREEINLTQKEMADKLCVSQQAYWRWEKGEVEITKAVAKQIEDFKIPSEVADEHKEKHPHYRAEYILGIDDYKTEFDYQDSLIIRYNEECKLANSAFRALTELNGYIWKPLTADTDLTTPFGERAAIQITTKNGYEILFSADELSRFNDELVGYVELRLKGMAKEGGFYA